VIHNFYTCCGNRDRNSSGQWTTLFRHTSHLIFFMSIHGIINELVFPNTITGCCATRHLTYEEPEGVEMRRPGMGIE
jgi:hypothetical protein